MYNGPIIQILTTFSEMFKSTKFTADHCVTSINFSFAFCGVILHCMYQWPYSYLWLLYWHWSFDANFCTIFSDVHTNVWLLVHVSGRYTIHSFCGLSSDSSIASCKVSSVRSVASSFNFQYPLFSLTPYCLTFKILPMVTLLKLGANILGSHLYCSTNI